MPHTDIDPELAAALQRFAQLDERTVELRDDYVKRRRLLSERQARLLRGAPLPDIQVTNHFASAPGREIALRSYAPRQNTSGYVLVWLHGGGWMVGSLDTHDDLCEHLAHYSGHTVLSVHYRRTPENPFPAAVEDCHYILQWLHDISRYLPHASNGILLGGDSAGAHLALATAAHRILHPSDAMPPIHGMLLFYPCIAPQQDTPSMQAFSEGYGLTRAAMAHYWQCLGGEAEPLRTPAACQQVWPQLPPMAVITASHDILRDEAEHFARALQAAAPHAPPVLLHRAPGMVHGFARMLAASQAARSQVQVACSLLQQLLPR